MRGAGSRFRFPVRSLPTRGSRRGKADVLGGYGKADVLGGEPTGKVNGLLDTLRAVHPDLCKLRDTFDDHVVGHSDAKEAFLLALLAREHIYIEGPPGVAKTMCALADLDPTTSG